MSPAPRVGLFLCNGGQLLSDKLDFESLRETGKSYQHVEVVREVGKICTQEGLSVLRKTLAEHHPDVLLLGACNLTQSRKSLAQLLKDEGLDTEAVETVNLRELAFRTDLSRESADRKAERALRMALEKTSCRDPIHYSELPVYKTVLVVGHGWAALNAAEEVTTLGHEVVLVCTENKLGIKAIRAGYNDFTASMLDSLLERCRNNPRIRTLLPSRISRVSGAAGRYRVLVRDENEVHHEFEVGGMILAPEARFEADFQAWNLSRSDQVLPLGDLEARLRSPGYYGKLEHPPGRTTTQVAFLVGFTHTSSPVTQRRVMEAALTLNRSKQFKSIVILDHFRVADRGLESLATEARKAGVLFAKPVRPQPTIQSSDSGFTVTLYDDALGETVQIQADLIVIEEALLPRNDAVRLKEVMELETDPLGFFQADNVYSLPIFTNRTGVLAIGPAKGAQSLEESFEEGREAALILHELLGDGTRKAAEDRVKLDKKKCTICLTCYRLCPHRAISVVNRRPVFSDLACQTCGICASECPMDAIQIYNFSDRQVRAQLKAATRRATRAESDGSTPVMVAFCCRNSAMEAARLASLRKWKRPEGLEIIEIPCAGKLDMDYVLQAFRNGADGVMVLGCHPDSCRSLHGNSLARWRVEELEERLTETGLSADRLLFAGLAPGMSREFVRIATTLERRLQEIGENPVRRAISFK